MLGGRRRAVEKNTNGRNVSRRWRVDSGRLVVSLQPLPPAALDGDQTTQRPGKLASMDAPRLTLHTHLGQRLFTGRKRSRDKAEIVGLVRFAAQVRILWRAACRDDPYADWWLVKLDRAFQDTEQTLSALLEQAQNRLAEVPGVSLSSAVSDKPVQRVLQFSSPYAYRGAYLLADLDRLARTVISARHYGLIGSNDQQRVLHLAGRAVRRTFLIAMSYQSLGLRRIDIRCGDKKVLQAEEAMGKIPEDIVNNHTRPRYAPARVFGPDSAQRLD